MTDWKMPGKWKEIFDEIHMYFELNFNVAMHAKCRTISQEFMFHPRSIISFIEALITAHLLSTPSERNAEERTLIELKDKISRAERQEEILRDAIAYGNAERDKREKQIGDAENENGQLFGEIILKDRQIAKLKSALDNAEKENNTAWVLDEKLKSGGQQKRIEELEAEVALQKEEVALLKLLSKIESTTNQQGEPPKCDGL